MTDHGTDGDQHGARASSRRDGGQGGPGRADPAATAGLGTVTLLRHGESVGNAREIFSGVLDVDLTPAGEEACTRAGARLLATGWSPDVVMTSELARGWRTALLVEETLGSEAPVQRDWRLNERSYGALSGHLKTEVAERYGTEQFRHWRRSLHGRPPELDEGTLTLWSGLSPFDRLPPEALAPTESLADVVERMRPWVDGTLMAQVRAGADVLVCAHGNSLRALCAILDRLTGEELKALNLPNARPLLYSFAADDSGELRPTRRGGRYLDPEAAWAEAEVIAAQGGT